MLAGVYVAAGKDPDIRYVAVTNEAEGASVAAGTWITGGRSVLVMENSGLRAACEALARLGLVNGVPVTMLMGYRGDLGERFHWGVNHGMTMEPILKALDSPTGSSTGRNRSFPRSAAPLCTELAVSTTRRESFERH